MGDEKKVKYDEAKPQNSRAQKDSNSTKERIQKDLVTGSSTSKTN